MYPRVPILCIHYYVRRFLFRAYDITFMTFPQFFGTSQRRPINQDGRSERSEQFCAG